MEANVFAEDPYEILGLSKSCSKTELRKAWKHLSTIHHPDKNGNTKEANELMMKINAAKRKVEVLEGFEAPTAGEETKGSADPGSGAAEEFDIGQFETLGKFGSGAIFGNPKSRFSSSKAKEIPVNVSVKHLFLGYEARFKGTSGKEVKVTIPPGTLPGDLIEAEGRKFRVFLNREDNDTAFDVVNGSLSVTFPLKAKDALLWTGNYTLEHLDGSMVEIWIPPPLDTARMYCVEGQGFVSKDGSRSPLLVRIEVSFSILSDEQREIISNVLMN
eukprot:TRINITY_DN1696_c0_g1_i1.p1 TRINITY_DN1696_c0_g1~~TRINITY_DN1696_c0_g1_i1.p1  ORF type:complete len:290 (-),score=71.41 TRINITY_DN1696_c0_g1_i1:60-878(-)